MSPARRASAHPYLDHPGPLALAHRGFSLDGLENSMAAFAAAVELGYRYVETDVHATSDAVAVAFHDDTLDRVTDHRGAIERLPWSRVRRARISGTEPIPTVEDLLGAWPDLRINMDVKASSAVAPLARVIERTASHHRVCIASFSDARRRALLRQLSAPVATSAGVRAVAAFRAASAVRVPALALPAVRGVHCLQVPMRARALDLVTDRTVAHAHALGLPVHVWTVNDGHEMTRLLDLGVDGIITDRADVLREILLARGTWRE